MYDAVKILFEGLTAGELIAGIIAIGSVATAITLGIRRMAKWHEDYVVQKMDARSTINASTELSKEIGAISQKIDQLDSSIKDIKDDLDNYKSNATQDMESMRECLSDVKNNYHSEDITLAKSINRMNDTVNILVESDKNNILSYITNEYYKWMDEKYIPLFAMQSLEYRFEDYTKEHGNHYAQDLMKRLRELPAEPPEKDK